MFCKKCGFQLPDDANFCIKCGTEVVLPDETKTESNAETSTTENPPSSITLPDTSQSTDFQEGTPQSQTEVESGNDLKKNLKNSLIACFILILVGTAVYKTVEPTFSQDIKARTQQKATEANAAEIKRERERKAAEEAERLKEANKPPITLTELVLEPDLIGQPTATLIFTNDSNKTIDAYTVRIYAYDNYGKKVTQFGIPDNDYFGGISQREIPPGASPSRNHMWTLHGFNTGRTFKACLMSIHFTDGSEWKALQPLDVSIEGKFNPD